MSTIPLIPRRITTRPKMDDTRIMKFPQVPLPTLGPQKEATEKGVGSRFDDPTLLNPD